MYKTHSSAVVKHKVGDLALTEDLLGDIAELEDVRVVVCEVGLKRP